MVLGDGWLGKSSALQAWDPEFGLQWSSKEPEQTKCASAQGLGGGCWQAGSWILLSINLANKWALRSWELLSEDSKTETIERTLAQAFACALTDAHIHTGVHAPQRIHTGQTMYVGLALFAVEPRRFNCPVFLVLVSCQGRGTSEELHVSLLQRARIHLKSECRFPERGLYYSLSFLGFRWFWDLWFQVTKAQRSAVRTRGISFLCCVRVRLGRSDMMELFVTQSPSGCYWAQL